tara:strand:- start:626 stop:859 length:234 start_codon:yes stop_codon:yes gene_type:complete
MKDAGYPLQVEIPSGSGGAEAVSECQRFSLEVWGVSVAGFSSLKEPALSWVTSSQCNVLTRYSLLMGKITISFYGRS